MCCIQVFEAYTDDDHTEQRDYSWEQPLTAEDKVIIITLIYPKYLIRRYETSSNHMVKMLSRDCACKYPNFVFQNNLQGTLKIIRREIY